MKIVEQFATSDGHCFGLAEMQVRTSGPKPPKRKSDVHEVLRAAKGGAHDKKNIKRERKYPHAYRSEAGL